MSDADDRQDPSSGPRESPVGYRRPPEATRFKPGQSGNPKGRPKGSKNFNTMFDEELRQPVTLRENGKARRVPKQQALIKQIINKALGNDLKAALVVFDHARRREGENERQPSKNEQGRAADEVVLENVVHRIRLAAACEGDQSGGREPNQ